MASEGLPVQPAVRALGCSESGYYASLVRAPSVRHVRHALLTETIRTIHTASRGVYGARRVHAELTKGHGLQVWHGTVEMLMARAGLKGVGGRPKRRARPDLISTDLVDRRFARDGVNELWVTDITEHPIAWIPAVVATAMRRPVKQRGARPGCPSPVIGVVGR